MPKEHHFKTSHKLERPSSPVYIQAINLSESDLHSLKVDSGIPISLSTVTDILSHVTATKFPDMGFDPSAIAPELSMFLWAYFFSDPKTILTIPGQQARSIIYHLIPKSNNIYLEPPGKKQLKIGYKINDDHFYQITIYEQISIYEENAKNSLQLESPSPSYIITSEYTLEYFPDNKEFKIVAIASAQLFLNFILLQNQLDKFFDIANHDEYFSNLSESQLIDGLHKFLEYEKQFEKKSAKPTELLHREKGAILAMRNLYKKSIKPHLQSDANEKIEKLITLFPDSFLKLAFTSLDTEDLFNLTTKQQKYIKIIDFLKLAFANLNAEDLFNLITKQQKYIQIIDLSMTDLGLAHKELSDDTDSDETLIKLSTIYQIIEKMTEFPDMGFDSSAIAPELNMFLWAYTLDPKKSTIPNQQAYTIISKLISATHERPEKEEVKISYKIENFNQITFYEYRYLYNAKDIEINSKLESPYFHDIIISAYTIKYIPANNSSEGYFRTSVSAKLLLNFSLFKNQLEKFLDVANQDEYFSNLSESQLIEGLLKFVEYEKKFQGDPTKTTEFIHRKNAAILAMQSLYRQFIKPYLKFDGNEIIKKFIGTFPGNSFLSLAFISIDEEDFFSLITEQQLQAANLLREISPRALKNYTADSVKILKNFFEKSQAKDLLENFVSIIDFTLIHSDLQALILSELYTRKLTYLSIKNCEQLTDDPLKQIIDNSKDTLQKLVITNCPITNGTFNVSDYQTLREFSIANCDQIKEIIISAPYSLTRVSINNCKNLEVLIVNGVNLTDISITACNNLSNLNIISLALTSINIKDCDNITDQELVKSLKTSNTLKTCTVENCKNIKVYQKFSHQLISQLIALDEEFSYFILLQIANSNEIIINNRALNKTQIEIISHILTQKLEIYTLELTYCNLNGSRFIPIADGIITNTHLRKVNLMGNSINSIENELFTSEFFSALTKSNIAALDLSYNKLNLATLNNLFNMPVLQKLNLTDNEMTLENLAEISSLLVKNFSIIELKLPKVKKSIFLESDLELDLEKQRLDNQKITRLTREISENIEFNKTLLDFHNAIKDKKINQVEEIFQSLSEAKQVGLLTRGPGISDNKAIHLAVMSGDDTTISFIIRKMLEYKINLLIKNANQHAAFNANTKLNVLNLSESDLNNETLINLFEALAICSSIDTLNLSDNDIKTINFDSTIAVKILKLSNNNLANDSFNNIFKCFPELQTLNVFNNYFTEQGLNHIVNSLQNHVGLINLSLYDTQFVIKENLYFDGHTYSKIPDEFEEKIRFIKLYQVIEANLFSTLIKDGFLLYFEKFPKSKLLQMNLDGSGNTALHWAALSENKDMLSFIIEQMCQQGLSLETKNKEGKMALELSSNKFKPVFEAIMKKKYGYTFKIYDRSQLRDGLFSHSAPNSAQSSPSQSPTPEKLSQSAPAEIPSSNTSHIPNGYYKS